LFEETDDVASSTVCRAMVRSRPKKPASFIAHNKAPGLESDFAFKISAKRRFLLPAIGRLLKPFRLSWFQCNWTILFRI
jgi:hypothetical protein